MKKMLLQILAVVIFIIIVGLLTKTNRGEATILSRFLPKTVSTTVTPSAVPTNLKGLKVGNTNVLVTIADTKETREKGLGGVENLPVNQGMLFVFENKNITPSFWMKGMKISIDFIWIKDNKVEGIDSNAPPPLPDTADNQLKVYTPNGPVDYVLEVGAGFAARNGIRIGDTVSFL